VLKVRSILYTSRRRSFLASSPSFLSWVAR